jgi:hypothetical protein
MIPVCQPYNILSNNVFHVDDAVDKVMVAQHHPFHPRMVPVHAPILPKNVAFVELLIASIAAGMSPDFPKESNRKATISRTCILAKRVHGQKMQPLLAPIVFPLDRR